MAEVRSDPCCGMFGGATDTCAVADEYDYVIVGGGTAGCVMAARLSEDEDVTVLLLEAGGDEQQLRIRVPAFFPKLQLDEDIDWMFRTEKQPALQGRVGFWPRGKLLGGCSSTNACAYVRGNRENYEEWASLGCAGWDWDSVLPYFKKAEDLALPHGVVDDDLHGRGGPLRVDLPMRRSPTGMSKLWVAASDRAGLGPTTKDYNGHEQRGAGLCQTTVRDGVRADAASSYLRPIIGRRNLTVATRAHVFKLLLEGKRARGVLFKRGAGKLESLRYASAHHVKARREVIVCAGAMCSPWLLMSSGIGPAEELAAVGVPAAVDLPVGRNLLDHTLVPIMFHARDSAPTEDHNRRSLLRQALQLVRWMVTKHGVASASPLQAVGFYDTGLHPGMKMPDLEIQVVPALINDEAIADADLTDAAPHLREGARPGRGIIMAPAVLHPRSVGRLTLVSADPFTPPRTDSGILEDEDDDDLQLLMEGIRICRRIAATEPLARELTGEVLDETIPASLEEDAYVEEYVRRYAVTNYHQVGTCRMGAATDARSVVDPQLRVLGVSALRVVDASIMPTHVSGNTQAAVYMIAEKAADMVKAAWKLGRPKL